MSEANANLTEATPKTYSYDEVIYPNNPFPQSHPDRLATIATLFGMKPAAITNCRVLELGCGRGGNIIPMAEQLPRSRFVGVELSKVQFTEAENLVKRLGLKNIELKHVNILDVDASFGEFDYIITHGVFSWVPRVVQDKIFEICQNHLAAQGVAYISYNTYPGWNMRRMIRDMMCYHSIKFSEPVRRIEQGRALLDFMAQHTSDKNPFGMFLKQEVEALRTQDDGYLYHEHLEDVNEPIYFYQFAERAEAHGLSYLGETDMSIMYSGHFPAEVTTTLERVASDLIQMEQYMDFIRNRMFRQTLLCRREVAIDRELSTADIEPLYVSSVLFPETSKADLLSAEPMRFREQGSERVVTAMSPLMKAALVCLAEASPGSIRYGELLSRARKRVDRRTIVSSSQFQSENQGLGTDLLRFYVNNLIELHSQPARFATEVGPRPVASALARLQAEKGDIVTNYRHGVHRINDVLRYILKDLDGTRDRHALMEILLQLVQSNVIVLQSDSADITREQALSAALDQILNQLARMALLVADPPEAASPEIMDEKRFVEDSTSQEATVEEEAAAPPNMAVAWSSVWRN